MLNHFSEKVSNLMTLKKSHPSHWWEWASIQYNKSMLPYNTFYIVVLSPPDFHGIHIFTKKKRRNMSLNWPSVANTSVQSVSLKEHLHWQRFSPERFLSTTSGSERTLCWLRPSCAAHASSWWRCPPWLTLPTVPGKVFHTCVCVCVCCPCTLWSSISWRGSGVGCP